MQPPTLPVPLTTDLKQLLVYECREALSYGLIHGRQQEVEADRYPRQLRQLRASFVTLLKSGELRGCIGSLQAVLPLIVDVTRNAWSAGFRDPRFAPLRSTELAALSVHIALLNPPQHFLCSNEAELLARLIPGQDGLVLQAGKKRATFLPSVWESLPEPASFVRALKRKAGLPEHYWGADMRCEIYDVESFSE